MDVEVAIVGAGGAGLSLLLALDAAGSGPGDPSVALVDPVHHLVDDRTWCFWDRAGSAGWTPPAVEGVVHRSWSTVLLVDRTGRERRLALGDLRYRMVRSADFYRLADDAGRRLGAVRVPIAVDSVSDSPVGPGGDEGRAGRAVVRGGGQEIRARWVFDSRPAPPRMAANTALLQHFRGWTVHYDRPVFDPELPVLMDFSVPQPARGVAFGYLLPSDPCRALVEYTQFSRGRLASAAYDAALQAYLQPRWGSGYTVEAIEDGAIPMTDAVHQRRSGHRVFRLGTAGGATRPSTGYTFAAMQRQAAGVAAALRAGRVPIPPAPHRSRHRWMDAVLLRAIDRGELSGADLFTRLFEVNPASLVLDVLDGRSRVGQDLAVIRSAPIAPMARATAQDVAARVRRRLAHRTATAE